MKRVLLFIAALFAFAAVAGPAMPYAGASAPSARAVAAAHGLGLDDRCDEILQLKASVFKLCPKKTGGKAVSCQLGPMLLPVVATPAPPQTRHTGLPALRTIDGGTMPDHPFRPPRAAA